MTKTQSKILEIIEDLLIEKHNIMQKYDNMLDELDFESNSYGYNQYEINEEKEEEINELRQQVPDCLFEVDGEEVTSLEVFDDELQVDDF